MDILRAAVIAIAATGAASLLAHKVEADTSDDWACQAILCMSNPGGATQFSECEPSTEKFWRWMSVPGHGFPQRPDAGPTVETTQEIWLCPQSTITMNDACVKPFPYADAQTDQTVQLVASFLPTLLPYMHQLKIGARGEGGITIYADASCRNFATETASTAPPVTQDQISAAEDQAIAAYLARTDGAGILGGNGGDWPNSGGLPPNVPNVRFPIVSDARADRNQTESGDRVKMLAKQIPRAAYVSPRERTSLYDFMGIASLKSSCPLVKKTIWSRSVTAPEPIVLSPIVGTSTLVPGFAANLPDFSRIAQYVAM